MQQNSAHTAHRTRDNNIYAAFKDTRLYSGGFLASD